MITPKRILIYILACAVLGSVIGVLGVLGILPRGVFEGALSITNLCIGLIVLIVDALCIAGLIRAAVLRGIDRGGIPVTGVIEHLRVIRRPDQVQAGDWEALARFAPTVSYKANGKPYCTELSPTCLTSRQKLYPMIMEEGCAVPLKMHRKHPEWIVIDNEALRAGRYAEQKQTRIWLVTIPAVVTMIYVGLMLR